MPSNIFREKVSNTKEFDFQKVFSYTNEPPTELEAIYWIDLSNRAQSIFRIQMGMQSARRLVRIDRHAGTVSQQCRSRLRSHSRYLGHRREQ